MSPSRNQVSDAKRSDAANASASAVKYDEVEVFVPMMSDGVTWLRICEPQHDAATACKRVAEYIRLLEPGREVGELEAAARSAAQELEAGARSATIVNDLHRVERSPVACT